MTKILCKKSSFLCERIHKVTVEFNIVVIKMLKSKIGLVIKQSPYKRVYIQERMGISRNTLSNWCRGITHPPAPELFKLARLLEVKVDDLYEWEEEE
ncbi:helix-turn-helix domain-containing protein [Pseudobacillus badius]|uniref:helix-turn-helix domain-containing protein n=1 Tax=Bacillus badius TaxID=1455 RepID=UPI000A3ECCA3